MAEIEVLAGILYAEEVARARAMTAEDKLLEGPRLFDRAYRIMSDGVRHQYPELDDARVRKLIEHRLATLRVLERR